MFKTLLASAGVGAARIDLVLDDSKVTMGETVAGKIIAVGGSTEQKVDELTVKFNMESYHGKNLNTIQREIASIEVTDDDFVIRPGEEKVFPFQFDCPFTLPVSSVSTKYYFDTNLEIKWGKDSKDRDYIDVLPAGFLKNFLDGFQLLGFKPKWEGLLEDDGKFSQLIQFQPVKQFRDDFEEVTFIYQTRKTYKGVKGYFEFDANTTGDHSVLIDMLNLDEMSGKFKFDADDLATPEKAKEKIEALVKKSLTQIEMK
ncbi:sporulation protein [Paenactinomyces guangxiensis]|uniref:Sporulation protein n=1 Tax=Paenactinomyces guangxiensis TaxID=1490290 RepID=A0A7W1WPX1_9BACL|nr:sporulation protein [Paenactinomyces guangxiensis]MBA4493882.1 sporulation protein [Paenactinomyces guangxiensis]MBH8591348.1 sporulation protein [Paenactinomyces guangxiensis]